jgi:broad specificity phosphatase PhoE
MVKSILMILRSLGRTMPDEYLATLPLSFTVYVARHATPDRTGVNIPYHLPPGPPLTERGEGEAARLGAFLHKARVTHMLASPLERAWRTACIAGEQARATVELNQDLAEWLPEENERIVMERVRRAFTTASQLSAHESTAVAIFSHGAPVLTLMRGLGLPKNIAEGCRIYDSRNLIPMGGAWRVDRVDGELLMDLAFVPDGLSLPTVLNKAA